MSETWEEAAPMFMKFLESLGFTVTETETGIFKVRPQIKMNVYSDLLTAYTDLRQMYAPTKKGQG